MGEKKDIIHEVEDTMACTAFADENEPCPIDDAEKKAESGKDKKMSVTDTLACSAFAEAGEPCPIDGKKKDK